MSIEKKIKDKYEKINEEKNSNLYINEFVKGIFKENPVFILLIGLCPALAVSNMFINGIGISIATLFVLLFSNITTSLLKNFIPEKVRTLAYIIIIASFVTIVEMLMKGFLPHLANSLGIYVPLIVVNCIIFTRAETFADKNTVGKSIMDAFGIGLGFIIALALISLIREFLGTSMIDFSDYIKINDDSNLTKFTLPIVNKDNSEISINLFGKKN